MIRERNSLQRKATQYAWGQSNASGGFFKESLIKFDLSLSIPSRAKQAAEKLIRAVGPGFIPDINPAE
jgi:hypothetical protein